MDETEFTEEEITHGKNAMRQKEFWEVYDDDDNNCFLLQAILDKYYNECPNTYTAEIVNHQNSSRLVVQCNVCSKTQLSSIDPFESHNNGKNHKKKLAERLNASDIEMKNQPIVVVFKNMEDNENPFEKGTLESELFNTTYDIIGYQFLYREMKNEGEFITCQLCGSFNDKYKQMNPSSARRHMQTPYHQDNYLRAKFDVKTTTLKDEHSRQLFINDVVRREGKLMHKIFTIDETFPESRSSRERKDSGSKSEVERECSSSRDLVPFKDPPPPETTEQFLEVLQGHLVHLNIKKCDDIITKLQEDLEATDLLISTANVLSQKIYLFAENFDPKFKEQARKLLEKCEKLRMPVLHE